MCKYLRYVEEAVRIRKLISKTIYTYHNIIKYNLYSNYLSKRRWSPIITKSCYGIRIVYYILPWYWSPTERRKIKDAKWDVSTIVLCHLWKKTREYVDIPRYINKMFCLYYAFSAMGLSLHIVGADCPRWDKSCSEIPFCPLSMWKMDRRKGCTCRRSPLYTRISPVLQKLVPI